MGQVVTFTDYQPTPRFDAIAWTEVRIYETDDPVDGVWTLIDTQPLDPVDADPSDPAYRSFTTEEGTAVDLWYRVIFADLDGDVAQPTVAIQNVSTVATPFATVAELARILKIRAPSTEQTEAMERVLVTAAGEITSEIDLADGESLAGWQLSLVEQVNLDRAADLWHHTESRTGLTGMLGDEGAVLTPGRYSWERYAQRLAPLKNQWGLA